MIFFRVIPLILINNQECFKSIKYKKKIYLGDPINIIKIFNDLGVDEIIIINLSNEIDSQFKYLKHLSEESFVPLTFGGGIRKLDDIEKILSIGYEKVSLNSTFYNDINFVKSATSEFGTSSISISVNLKKNIFGKYYLYDHYHKKIIKNINLDRCLENLDQIEVSEVCFNFVDREGMRVGYDFETIEIIKKYMKNKNFIINGGAKDLNDFLFLKKNNFSGAVASSLFSFMNSNESILINYISENDRKIIDENTKI